MFFDPATRGIPLDATLVKGSHGRAGEPHAELGPVLLCSDNAILPVGGEPLRDVDIAPLILRQFGCDPQ